MDMYVCMYMHVCMYACLVSPAKVFCKITFEKLVYPVHVYYTHYCISYMLLNYIRHDLECDLEGNLNER